MSNNIEGKVVVITGASSGLGEAAARHLSKEGAMVVLGARRIDRIKTLASELTGAGRKAIALQTDVTKHEQVKALVDATVTSFGRIEPRARSAAEAVGGTQARHARADRTPVRRVGPRWLGQSLGREIENRR